MYPRVVKQSAANVRHGGDRRKGAPRFQTLAWIALFGLSLAGSAHAQATAAASPGPLRLAMSGAFQPFSTTDASGALVGLDADIARELSRRLGRPAELVQIDWAGIQAALQTRKVDLICGSMAITAERLQTMHFSLPYYVSGAQVFAREGVSSLHGARVGVTEDSTYARYIAAHPKRFAGATVSRFGSEAEIVAALRTDKVDVFVSDRIVGGFYISRGGATDVRPLGPPLYDEACGIAARRDDEALVREVNAALFAMVQDGTYARIYERWVGALPDLDRLLSSWGAHAQHIPASDASGADDERARPAFADRVATMLPLLARGAWLTVQLSGLTALLSLLFGVVLAVLSISRRTRTGAVLARAVDVYVWLVRGTPLLVQLFIAYFAIATALNRIVGFELMGAFAAALLALVVNTTAYNTETVRGGLIAVDKGQWEAAFALGMTRRLALRRVVLPQALRAVLPSLGNNLIVLVKDTSLVGAVTLIELTYSARNVVFQTGQAVVPFLVAGALYLLIIGTLSIGVARWERRLSRARGSAP